MVAFNQLVREVFSVVRRHLQGTVCERRAENHREEASDRKLHVVDLPKLLNAMKQLVAQLKDTIARENNLDPLEEIGIDEITDATSYLQVVATRMREFIEKFKADAVSALRDDELQCHEEHASRIATKLAVILADPIFKLAKQNHHLHVPLDTSFNSDETQRQLQLLGECIRDCGKLLTTFAPGGTSMEEKLTRILVGMLKRTAEVGPRQMLRSSTDVGVRSSNEFLCIAEHTIASEQLDDSLARISDLQDIVAKWGCILQDDFLQRRAQIQELAMKVAALHSCIGSLNDITSLLSRCLLLNLGSWELSETLVFIFQKWISYDEIVAAHLSLEKTRDALAEEKAFRRLKASEHGSFVKLLASESSEEFMFIGEL